MAEINSERAAFALMQTHLLSESNLADSSNAPIAEEGTVHVLRHDTNFAIRGNLC